MRGQSLEKRQVRAETGRAFTELEEKRPLAHSVLPSFPACKVEIREGRARCQVAARWQGIKRLVSGYCGRNGERAYSNYHQKSEQSTKQNSLIMNQMLNQLKHLI